MPAGGVAVLVWVTCSWKAGGLSKCSVHSPLCTSGCLFLVGSETDVLPCSPHPPWYRLTQVPSVRKCYRRSYALRNTLRHPPLALPGPRAQVGWQDCFSRGSFPAVLCSALGRTQGTFLPNLPQATSSACGRRFRPTNGWHWGWVQGAITVFHNWSPRAPHLARVCHFLPSWWKCQLTLHYML